MALAGPLTLKTLKLRIESDDSHYEGLKKLKITGKDLGRLPNSVFSLIELEVLDLSPEREACLDYKLPVLRPEIGKLSNLKILVLDTNELTQLPSEICLLKNLERLALSNNLLSTLPARFSDLKSLVSLHLANNQFDEFPTQLCRLNNLEFLDLSDNQISVLPDEIANMQNLQSLLLFYNKLTELPVGLCKLENMRCLWLGNNLIRELPREFAKLKELDWGMAYTSSAIDGNPLEYPPIEICRLGSEAIEKYMNGTTDDKSDSDSNEQTVTLERHSSLSHT